MRFNVEGADARTGSDRVVSVEAADRRQAEAKARAQGLLVSAVHESAAALTAAERLDRMVDDTASREPPAALAYQTPRAVAGATSAAARGPVPSYFGLRLAASAMMIMAMLFYVTGAAYVVLAVIAMGAGTANGQTGAGALMGAAGIAFALTPLAAGALMHGASAACVALRDIARNSFG